MLLKTETSKIQEDLAKFCRSGELTTKIPVSREASLSHYRRLVFNVVKNALKQAYPITHKLLKGKEWNTLVKRFFIEHDCQTPQVWKMPEEFAIYVKESGYVEKSDRPYLNDLLLFEWTEIEVHTMPDKDIPPIKKEGNLFSNILVLNPEFRMLNLKYPIHIRPGGEAARLEGNYYVLIFREPETGRVKFISLSMLFAFVTEQLSTHDIPLKQLIKDCKKIFEIEDESKLKKEMVAFAEDLLYQKMILGFGN